MRTVVGYFIFGKINDGCGVLVRCCRWYLYSAIELERFHHVMKNDVTSAHDGRLGVRVDRSLYGKVWSYAASAITSHI